MERYSSQRDTFIEKISERTGKVSFSWFFMSPVREKMISYTDLLDGKLTLFDLYKMNEALEYENDLRENLRNELEAQNGK